MRAIRMTADRAAADESGARLGAAAGRGGLAAWLLSSWRVRTWGRNGAPREMVLVEQLALGGKRHLALVSCAGERFLVGGGAEGVAVIVRIGADARDGENGAENGARP